MFRKTMMMSVAAVAVAMVGCVSDPVRAAKTPLQTAYAALQDYETAQQFGLAFVEDKNTPAAVKDGLIKAESAATALVHPTRVAAQTVEQIRKDLQAGKSTQEQLAIATQNLNQWTLNLQKAVDEFSAAIEKAKGSLKSGWLILPEPDVVPVGLMRT